MGADCKSVAKASKVRILHLPRNSMRGPASTAGPLAFLGVGRTGRSRGGAECEFTTGQRAAKCEFTTGQRAAKCEFTTGQRRAGALGPETMRDRKSTRLNSSH